MRRRLRLATLVASVGAAGAMVWLAHRQPPVVLGPQFRLLCLGIGTFIWPSVLSPWLGRLPRRWRPWLAWIAVPLAFWIQGEPLVGFVHGFPVPNTGLFLFIITAGVMASIMAELAAGQLVRGMYWWLPSVALLVAIAAQVLTGFSVTRVIGAAPGKVLVKDLTLAETSMISGVPPTERHLEGFSRDNVIFVFAEDTVVRWTETDGFKTRHLPLRAGGLEVRVDGERFYLLEKSTGRIRCLDPDGRILWETAELGSANQVVWTEGNVWLLGYPAATVQPDQVRVRLSAVSLADGVWGIFEVKPPEGTRWSPPTPFVEWAYLAACGNTAAVVGFAFPIDGPGSQTEPRAFAVKANLHGISPRETDLSPLPVRATALPEVGRSPLGVFEDTLIYIGEQLYLAAYDLNSGNQLWSQPLPSRLAEAELHLTPSEVVLSGQQSSSAGTADSSAVRRGLLVGYDLRSGKEAFVHEFPEEAVRAEPVGHDLVVIGDEGTVTRIGLGGRVEWTQQLGPGCRLLWMSKATDQLALFEPESRKAPAVLRLSDGAILSRQSNVVNSFDYLLSDRTLVRLRSPGAPRQMVLLVKGDDVQILDLLKQTNSVLTTSSAILAVGAEGSEITFYLLRPARQ
ncbi:MAG TPA: PQQ-binding-like beta-propeller repeat protein [Bacillota bacterium]